MSPNEPLPVFLLAEDSESDVLFFKRALDATGVQVPFVVVSDGQKTQDYVAGQGNYADRTLFPAPGLLLLDLKMPKKSGLEILEWMKSKELKSPRVVVLSSSDDPSDIEKSYAMGAAAYLVKPVSFGLLKKVAKALVAYWRNPHASADELLGWYLRRPPA